VTPLRMEVQSELHTVNLDLLSCCTIPTLIFYLVITDDQSGNYVIGSDIGPDGLLVRAQLDLVLIAYKTFDHHRL
jgi:hypothetical protein